MSDERLRDLARRAAVGDPEAKVALQRARRRAHVHECEMKYAGKIEKGKRYLARVTCWTCGKIQLFGDQELLEQAREVWGADLGASRLDPFTAYADY